MANQPLETIVKILQKNQNKTVDLSVFEGRLQSAFTEPLSKGKIYKLTHQLKNKWYLMSLRKDVFYVKMPDKSVDAPFLEEKFYWNMLKSHCKLYCNTNRYIGNLTALELNLHTNCLIPEEIIVVNDKKQSIETVIFDKKINFKTYEVKKKNLYSSFVKFTKKLKIQGWTFNCANLELAILECLYCPTISTKSYSETLILKAIKVHQKILSFDMFEAILSTGKHCSSANRLMKLTQKNFPDFSDQLKQLIKKYGNLQ